MSPLIDPELLVRLRCPRCHRDLTEDGGAGELVCADGHRYPVIDGIPDMVVGD